MPIEIRRVSPADIKLNALVYGVPGVGKTSLAATAGDHPDMSPALVLNLEGGLLSIAGRGDVDEVRITEIKDLEDVLAALYAGDKKYTKYQTIVIDSGSELAKMSLNEKVAIGVERTRMKDRSSDRTLDDVQIEDYGASQREMGRIFRAFRDMPVHTVMTSLALHKYRSASKQNPNPDMTAPISIGPDFSAGLQRAVLGMFDFVWYMYVDRHGNRAIQTRRQGVIEAKTRGPAFADTIGPIVVEPDLAELYATLLATEAGIGEVPERFLEVEEDDGISDEDEIETA